MGNGTQSLHPESRHQAPPVLGWRWPPASLHAQQSRLAKFWPQSKLSSSWPRGVNALLAFIIPSLTHVSQHQLPLPELLLRKLRRPPETPHDMQPWQGVPHPLAQSSSHSPGRCCAPSPHHDHTESPFIYFSQSPSLIRSRKVARSSAPYKGTMPLAMICSSTLLPFPSPPDAMQCLQDPSALGDPQECNVRSEPCLPLTFLRACARKQPC